MNILETYYTYAKLATAAYIDLSAIGDYWRAPGGSVLPQNVIDTGASDDQERLPRILGEQMFGLGIYAASDHWTVLSPYYRTGGRTGHSDPDSGFAGMLLSHPTLGKVLAIAGTEPQLGNGQAWQDLIRADIEQIGGLGVSFKQLVSLFNYVQVLKATAGATDVLRLEVVTATLPPEAGTNYVVGGIPPQFWWLVEHHDGVGQGKLDAGEKITVTGHSLGGHLAALAVALFPETFTTAYTFNAPGYNPLAPSPTAGANTVLDMFRAYGAAPLSVTALAPRVVTLESEDAIPGDDAELVSGNFTGTPFSPEQYIGTEKVTHDIGASCKTQESELRTRFVLPLGAIFVAGRSVVIARLARWHSFHDVGRTSSCRTGCMGGPDGLCSVIVATASTGRPTEPEHRTSSVPSPSHGP